MNEANLIVLAAGLSSRMRRAAQSNLDPALLRDAESKSKSMISLGEGGRPFLDYLLYNVWQAGYRDVVLVVGENDTSIRRHYGPSDSDNQYHGLTIGYATQRIPPGRVKPLGTADALLQGLRSRPDWEHQRVTVCNSDNLYSARALALLLASPASCSVIDYDRDALRFPPERIGQFGIFDKRDDGTVLEIIEKPTLDDIARCSDARGRVGVSMNLWRFRSSLITPALEQTPLDPLRNERELPTAVTLMLRKHPGSLTAYPVAEYVPDLTMRDDIAFVKEFIDREYKTLVWP
jgi:ADP-glucose pyrophosphorylase